MSKIVAFATAVGRRRFIVTVACFLIANICAWGLYAHYFGPRVRGTLFVESFEPGDGHIVSGRQAVVWHFNTDVIPTSAYGRDPGSVSPQVTGRWAWDDSRTLRFSPQADFPRATRVTFTLADTLLRSLGDARLGQPFVATVNSSPLAIQRVVQAGIQEDNRFVIEMVFNDRVVPGDVLAHLTARRANGANVHLQLHGQAAGSTVRLITDSIPLNGDDASIAIEVSPGLTGMSGPLGLQSPYSANVSLGHALSATRLDAESPPRGSGYLELYFNDAVDLAALKQVISIEPALNVTCENPGYSNEVRIDGDFKPGTRYTVRLANAPAGVDARKYPLPGQLAAFIPDRQSGVWFDTEQGYLSSAGNRTLMLHAVNVEAVNIRVLRVYDNNLVAWRNAGDRYWAEGSEPYSGILAERKLPLAHDKNVQNDIPLSLDELLPATDARQGVYRVEVEPKGKSLPSDSDDGYAYSRPVSSVVTMSDIALTAKQTSQGAMVWATSLRTTKPMAGVRVRLFSNKNQPLGEAVTDKDGVANFTDVHPAKEETLAVVLADCLPAAPVDLIGPPAPGSADAKPSTAATDLTWLDLRQTAWELGDTDIGGPAYLRTGHEAFVYTERGVYRPGETVHLRAIVRGADNAAPTAAFPVRWKIQRPDLRDWKTQTVMLDADGMAQLDVALPADISTGMWTASIGLPGDDEQNPAFGSVVFGVEEFIPNRMKVDLKFKQAAARYTVSDEPLKADVQADYLFGRPAAGLTMELSARAVPVAFHPQGWNEFDFGDVERATGAAGNRSGSSHRVLQSKSGDKKELLTDVEETLDDAGHFTWPLDVKSAIEASEPRVAAGERYMGPWKVMASAGVREAGGRAVTASKAIEVDELPFYIGMRREGTGSPAPGQACEFQVRLVRPDGSSKDGGKLEATLLRCDWNTTFTYNNGQYRYESTRTLEPVENATVNAEGGKASWSPTIPSSGEYVVGFSDPATNARSSMEFYATDGSPWEDNVSRSNPEHVDVRILPAGAATQPSDDPAQPGARSQFRVGDVANVLIASPFTGRLLLTVETDEIVQTKVIEMTGSHVVVPIKITGNCRPGAFVSATVIRPVDPNAKWAAHRAFGLTRLNVDPSDRSLKIVMEIPAQIRPLQSLDVGLYVTANDGSPRANAAVTVAAVDEGICDLTDFKTPDPLKFFAAARALGVHSFDFYDDLMPEVARPDKQPAVGGDVAGLLGRHLTPVVARRVKPVALAWMLVHTDEKGYARTSFSVPEFQGKLRVMAVACAGQAFGSQDQGVVVRSPILAQSSWPRFAAPGDRFSVPIVLFNNTETPGQAKISAELVEDPATPPGIMTFGDKGGKSIQLAPVNLEASGQAQADLPVVIGQAAGVTRVRLSATMNGETYSENMELPIRPAAPFTQQGGYLAASTTQPTVIAKSVPMLAGTESFHVNVTPWPTLELSQGLDYLDRYPYGCVEQTTSTCFPLIALAEIGRQIDPVRFDPERIKRNIDAGILRLIGMQTADGGLAMWAGEQDPWPYASVYAANFLVEAKIAGYQVPDEFYRKLMGYVRRQLDQSMDDSNELELQSYAAYVLALAGKTDRASLNRLTELAGAGVKPGEDRNDEAMRSDSRLMLSCAWLLSGRRDLAEGLIPDVLPTPRPSRQSEGNIGSPIRDRAVLINTLIMVHPDSALLPRLVQDLSDTGIRREWQSTNDTAMAVLAIGKYLRDALKHKHYEQARLLLDKRELASVGDGSVAWDGIPGEGQLTVEIRGAADALGHVSWIQNGVPLAIPKDASHGMTITRKYLMVDGRPLAGNIARCGDLVRVQIKVDAPANQANLAIEDLLPAGLEAENPRLKTSAKSEDENDDSTFESQRIDVRDDRVIVFGKMPDRATATCEYLARAVTPGQYVLPPVRIEAMYDISVNAISGGGGKFIVTSAHSDIASTGDEP